MNVSKAEEKSLRKNICPDCGHKEFLAGPEGGGSQNFKCAYCGSRFNDMGPFGMERIGQPPRKRIFTK